MTILEEYLSKSGNEFDYLLKVDVVVVYFIKIEAEIEYFINLQNIYIAIILAYLLVLKVIWVVEKIWRILP